MGVVRFFATHKPKRASERAESAPSLCAPASDREHTLTLPHLPYRLFDSVYFCSCERALASDRLSLCVISDSFSGCSK